MPNFRDSANLIALAISAAGLIPLYYDRRRKLIVCLLAVTICGAFGFRLADDRQYRAALLLVKKEIIRSVGLNRKTFDDIVTGSNYRDVAILREAIEELVRTDYMRYED